MFYQHNYLWLLCPTKAIKRSATLNHILKIKGKLIDQNKGYDFKQKNHNKDSLVLFFSWIYLF
ncbi:hypothetical protein CLV62_10633 [Dysgonomonas alginatilytica]|uniref:Uncharacterized protein n=1 Tax=Dysgonomonas alginatilytica TaxID=1605892 RepID=A0A2V3PT61_9BACT|nr:hypothetical protein CLV62_10633 [Dysgonomonas alginatilytica]